MAAHPDALDHAPRPISLTDARGRLMQLPAQLAEEPNTTLEVTRRGEPVLAIMSWQLYESLIVTLLVLGDHELMNALKASLADIAAGRTFSTDEVRRQLAP